MSFLSVVLFGLIVSFIFLLADLMFPDSDRQILERLEGLKLYNASDRQRKMSKPLLTRIYEGLETFAIRNFSDQISKGGSLAPLRIKLIQAGSELDPLQHRAKRFIFAFIFTAFSAIVSKGDVKIIMFVMVIGYIYPDYKLNKQREARQMKLKEEVPDFLDLLASVFPGCKGFEDAVDRICKRSSGLIVDEFQTTINEIAAGKRKRDALQAMAQRCGVLEIDGLINQIIQSDILGTDMSNTLKQQALKLREMKKTIAEIKARNAAIALLMPSIFLLVAILIVIAGPSILQFLGAFSSM